MAKSEFVQLPGGGAQITLSTGLMKGGMAGIVVGSIGVAIVTGLYLGTKLPACVTFGCGGFAAIVFLLGVWALISAVIVGGRLADATLTLSHYPLRLGERFEVAYEQGVRSTHEISSVTLTLKCEELARYRVGTDTRTVKHTALEVKQILLEGGTASPAAPLAASVEFQIPTEAMHSFDQTNNKITWTLKLKTDIAKLPDYDAECKLEVVPRLAEAGGGQPAIPFHPEADESKDEDVPDGESDEENA